MYYLCKMKAKILYLFLLLTVLTGCHESYPHKTVVCIPVYGQSLALGEEATRMTDFDSLAAYADGRIVTERLDHHYGFFDNNNILQWGKRLVGYHRRSFELTVYSMAQVLADSLGSDTLVCIFPGGRGGTTIAHLNKGTKPYQRFIDDIQTAYSTARERGWDFIVPAICWMQGESDIEYYPKTDYKTLLKQFSNDISADIRHITHQDANIHIISYQNNNVSGGVKFRPDSFACAEMKVPQAQLELVRDDSMFVGSGPTYPYTFVRERIHIDAAGHQQHGRLVARAALDLLHHRRHHTVLLPQRINSQEQQAVIAFDTTAQPLVLDTTHVTKAQHYGFSVITPDNRNILEQVTLSENSVILHCSEPTSGSSVRYAVNGSPMHSGSPQGPRGNLRDANGNWCWQFCVVAEPSE